MEDWGRHLAVFRENLSVLPQLVDGVSAGRLRRVPATGEWSAHDIVCHLVLDEMSTTVILRLILTEDNPLLPGLDADNRFCATRFAPLYPDTATALDLWRALREDNLRLCASLSANDLERAGRASWRNGETITLRHYVASRGRHDGVHIAQIEAALSG